MIKPSSLSDQGFGDHKKNGCAECDPEIVDQLKCEAEGVQAQADYNAKQLPDLNVARTSYDKVRVGYRDARHGLVRQVHDLRDQIKYLIEQIKCRIKQDHVVECLDEAYDKVADQLKKCGGATGCCIDDDCEFDTDLSDIAPDKIDEVLARWIIEYQQRVNAAKACFNDLVQEPGRLTTRVADLKTEITDIAKDVDGEPANTDLKELYARALVAKKHVYEIWLGFKNTSEFTECLCRALMCWSRGSSVIAVLIGKQAVRSCHKKAWQDHCEYLKEHTVKEILAVYDKICSKHDECDDDDKKDDDDEPC